MQLKLDLPEGSKHTEIRGNSMAVIDPGLVVEVTRIIELPEGIADWSHNTPLRDAPPGVARVEVIHRFDDKTELGWPMAVYESKTFDDAGVVLQHRIHAVYLLIEHGAIVAVRASDGDRLAAWRDQLLATLRTARPDWGVPPDASIEDLLTA